MLHKALLTSCFWTCQKIARKTSKREISKATQNNSNLGLKYVYCTDDDGFTITKILSWPQEQKG